MFTVTELHSGEPVCIRHVGGSSGLWGQVHASSVTDGCEPGVWDTREEAATWAVNTFGPDAGKEMVVTVIPHAG